MPTKSDFPPVQVADEPFPPRLLSTIWQHFAADPQKVALANARVPSSDFVTFGELYAFSLAGAAFLRQRGFGPGDVACLALPNSWEWAVIFLAVGLRGGAISGANPMFTDKELQQQFSDSHARVVFCSRENLERVIQSANSVPSIQQIILVECGKSKLPIEEQMDLPFGVIRFGQVLRTEPENSGDFPVKHCRPDKDVLLLPYSSGTTGPPKGVMNTHRNLGTMINIKMYHFRHYILNHMHPAYVERDENELLLLPFFHCYGFGMLMICLLNGSTGYVMAGFEPDLFCKTIQDFKIRILKIVPPILVFLAKNSKVRKYDLSCMHVIFSGAAPAGGDLCEELKRRFPTLQHIAQGYGMTEMTIASHLPVLDKPRHESSGKLASNLEMKILDISTGQEVDPGMPGELYVRGPTVMLGYLGRPVETAEIIDADGWLRTGDIACVDKEGFIHIVDRLKELIKVNGLQVAPAELEDLLLSHPDVEDAAVVGVPDPVSGELPCAFVVRRAGSDISETEIQQFVKAKAVYYKQLKGGVRFVSTIPKSPSGKILRRLLRDVVKNEGKDSENHMLSKL